jgi:pectate lyase
MDDASAVGGWPVYTGGEAPADTDGDGMPDEWEKRNGLNPADGADGNVIAGNGYTNLENYLNEEL